MKYLLFLFLTAAALAAPEIPFLSSPPVIDGQPGDPAWADAVLESNFISTQDYFSSYQAQVWYGRSETHFYAAFLCEHGDIANIVQQCLEKDSAVYFDDCVEVFFDASGRRQEYYQVLANVQGAIYDQYVDRHGRTSVAWDSDAQAAGSIQDQSFYIELSIPLASMNFSENQSAEIGLALCRTLNYYRDWKYVYGKYHEIDTWKRFAQPVQLPITLQSFQGSRFGGRHAWQFVLKNNHPQALALKGIFQFGNEAGQPVTLTIPAEQSKELSFAVLQVPGQQTEVRLQLQNTADSREVLHFYRGFRPDKLLDAIPISNVLYRGEKFQAEININENPDAPLTAQVIGPDNAVVWQQEFRLSSCQTRISLPVELKQASIILQYKGNSQNVKITTLDSPWL